MRETLVVAAFVTVRVAASAIAELLFGITATDAMNLVAAIAVMVDAGVHATGPSRYE